MEVTVQVIKFTKAKKKKKMHDSLPEKASLKRDMVIS